MFNQKSIKGTFFVTLMLILAACGEVGPSPSFSSVSNSSATTSSSATTTSYIDSSSSSETSSSSSNSTPSSSEVPSEEQYQIYLLAIQSGYEGTYEEWLDSIKGADGTSLLSGTTNPESTLGKNGDTYINTSTWDVFVKSGGNWTKVGNVMGPKGETGEQGPPGADGQTPYIGTNGNWWIGTTDTGIPATGPAGENGTNGTNGVDGQTPYIGTNGNWWIGTTDTGIPATGPAGENGTNGTNGVDGQTPYIGTNGNWWIGTTDTGIPATGPAGENGTNGTNGVDGQTPYIGTNGNWWIGTTDTGIPATGPAGENGTNGTNGVDGADGQDGLTPYIGTNGNWWIGTTDTGIPATGPAGENGTNGTNGVDGQDGVNGEDGLSAYEIYKKYYPGYPGTEQDWINDFVTNQLVKTVTLNFDGGTTSTYKTTYFKGEQLETLPTTTKQYYTFDSWQVNNQTISNTYYVVGNITITAKWNIVEGTILVTNAAELNNIRNFLNGTFLLANDIDLGSQEWTPIGSDTEPFTGFLDGQGYTISNLKITESQVYVGLFGYNRGIIKNLTIDGVEINVVGVINQLIYAGTFAGRSERGFENLNAKKGFINIKILFGFNGYLGGIVGYLNQKNTQLLNLYNNIDVIGDMTTHNGGLVGYSANSPTYVLQSNNAGLIRSNNGYVAGLVGYLEWEGDYSFIENCVNSGDIYGLNYVGGLSAYSRFSSIKDSSNTGKIFGNSYLGGLVGWSNGQTQNSYNAGDIYGLGSFVGGLVGYRASSDLKDAAKSSYNSGKILGVSNVGGLFGYCMGTIKFSFNYGEITSSANYTGGLAGYFKGTLSSVFNLAKISGKYYVGGLVGQQEEYLSNYSFNKVFNSGVVSGTGNIGGLVGRSYKIQLTNSFNLGAISGTSDVGGFIGVSGNPTNINSSINAGIVSGSDKLGGFVGSIHSGLYIYKSVNVGNIIASSSSTNLGHFVGLVTTTTHDTLDIFYSSTITYNDLVLDGFNIGGQYIETSQLNNNFFIDSLLWNSSNWDFTGLDIANGVYPTLKNMPEIPVEE